MSLDWKVERLEDHPTMAQGGAKVTPWWAWCIEMAMSFPSSRIHLLLLADDGSHIMPHSRIKPGEICYRIRYVCLRRGPNTTCFNWAGYWNSTADHYFPQILAGSERATVIHKSRQHQTWFWLENFWIRLQGCFNFGVFSFWLQVKINYDFLLWVGSWFLS